MSFVNVGTCPSTNTNPNGSKSNPTTPGIGSHTPILTKESAPVLASCYSEPFQVFSAKKFPGVIESTSLSKCFALQGIKIPIRKDGKGGSTGGRGSMSVTGDGDGYDADD
jgi:hypothetical protein